MISHKRLLQTPVVFACLLLVSCASLPEKYVREPSWKLDASDSRLAIAFDRELAAQPGQSGAYPLSQGMEALAARVVLASTAEKFLDVQYYIWSADESGKLLIKELLDAADRGVRVRIVTNSLASTDVGAVHAGYRKYRRELLEGGVELYEMMPSLNVDTKEAGAFSFTGSAAASLHAKMFLFDRQRVFIGSMNLDPRSVYINTEIGLLIDSPTLAQQLELNVAKILGNICYSVVLEPKNPSKPEAGQRLVWIEHDQGEEIRYTKEPKTTSWQRLSVGLIGLLPVESQL